MSGRRLVGGGRGGDGRVGVNSGRSVVGRNVGGSGSSVGGGGRNVGGRSVGGGSRGGSAIVGGRSVSGGSRGRRSGGGTGASSGSPSTGVGRGAGGGERIVSGSSVGGGGRNVGGGSVGGGSRGGSAIVGGRSVGGGSRGGRSGGGTGASSGSPSTGVGRGASGGGRIVSGSSSGEMSAGGASDRRSGGSNVGGRSDYGNMSGDMSDEDYHLSDDSYYDGSSEDTEDSGYDDDIYADVGGSNSGRIGGSSIIRAGGNGSGGAGGSASGGAGGSGSGGAGGSGSGGAGGSGSGGVGGSGGAGASGIGDEGEDGEGEGWEGEEEAVEEAEHARRGYSVGIYGHPPRRPHRIRMLGRVIDSPTACRTLLALMRVHWPAGCIGALDIDRRFPRWWRFIRDEFFRYFEFDPRHGTLENAREAVRHHMRNNLRKTLCNERIRVQKIINENGGDFIDHRPAYLSDDVWKAFCDHWASPEFQRRSEAARAARQHQNNPHTSGAISFQRRAWDIRDKEGEEPARYDLFIRMHTKKNSTEFTSESVKAVVDKYLALCNTQNKDPKEASIDTWAEAVGVRKNSIIGVPRMRASDLIPLSPTSSRRRRRRVDDEGRSIIDYMADDLVMQAVDRTVAYARAHPDQFNLEPEQVKTLAESVVDGVSELPSDHPLSMATMRELVQVMVSVLADFNARPRPTRKEKGKMIVREDQCSSSDSDDEPQGPPSPPAGRRRGAGIHIRGD